jgi:hypothetical protein
MPGNTIAQFAAGASAAGPARAWTTILYAGLIAGMTDITSAIINGGLHGRSFVWVLQSVAGGLLGRNTFQGGLRTAALGLALHFLIATTWAAVYYAASLRLPLLTRQAVVCGLLYGVVVYLYMYTVVLPLSALRFKFFNQSASAILTGVLIHLLCVGLPIALVTRWRRK